MTLNKSVTVIGLGYIGLPTALLIADAGIITKGFDVDASKIELLQNHKLYFEEKGLSELFISVTTKKSFEASLSITPSDIYIIAVPTPTQHGSADLQYIFAALEAVEKIFQPGNLIVLESTVAPRDCADRVVPEIFTWNKNFLFSHCPERAIPGNTLHEMKCNDRIIGGLTEESISATIALYKNFVTGNFHTTDPTTAASSKVMENTFRSVNIALANEFARLAESLGFDVWEAITLANRHPRVNIHAPGSGVGGHCIPVDPWFFVTDEVEQSVIKTSLLLNQSIPDKIVAKVLRIIKAGNLTNPVVGILGYAYKKNVNDVRETPAKQLLSGFSKHFQTLVSDPYVYQEKFLDLDVLLSKVDVIVLATNHDVYANIFFSEYSNIKLVYDAHNFFGEKNFQGSTAKHIILGNSKE